MHTNTNTLHTKPTLSLWAIVIIQFKFILLNVEELARKYIGTTTLEFGCSSLTEALDVCCVCVCVNEHHITIHNECSSIELMRYLVLADFRCHENVEHSVRFRYYMLFTISYMSHAFISYMEWLEYGLEICSVCLCHPSPLVVPSYHFACSCSRAGAWDTYIVSTCVGRPHSCYRFLV